MLQIHSIVLWADSRNEDFDTTVMRAYNTMQALKAFGTEISPNYLTVSRKKNEEPFEWSYEGFRDVLIKGINKEGGKVFPELGYSFSFFSSLNEKDSAAISMTVGVTNPNFKNTLVVNLPKSLSLFDNQLISEKLALTFKKCISAFEPFWGCIANKVNLRRFKEYLENGLPTTTHWVNYWSDEIVNRIGVEKLESPFDYQLEKLNDGYIIQLKDSPINDESEYDLAFQSQINKYLCL